MVKHISELELFYSDDKRTIIDYGSLGSFSCVVVLLPENVMYPKILPCFFQLFQMKKGKLLKFLYSAKKPALNNQQAFYPESFFP